MNDYQIFVDLSADVNVSFAKENNIGLIPMQYSLGDDFRTASYLESDEVLKAFYDSQRKGDFTKTTQITPYVYEEFFKPYCQKGIDILYMTLSSGLSKTYESALLAASNLHDEYPNVKISIIDSLSATGGLGVLCDLAVRNKNNGMNLEDNTQSIIGATHRIKHWFLVEDLNYLKCHKK
ncbi:MAG: DegV family protein [Anaeroplasmataceae bacterium]